MKTWIDCGCGSLLHPVSKAPVTTRVIELKGVGRIAEVFHYGNEPEEDFKLILAAPALLRELEQRAGNLRVIADYLQLWHHHGVVKPCGADTPTLQTMIDAARICAGQAQTVIDSITL